MERNEFFSKYEMDVYFMQDWTLNPYIPWVIKTELLIDPIPNSPNQHNENRLADSKENY